MNRLGGLACAVALLVTGIAGPALAQFQFQLTYPELPGTATQGGSGPAWASCDPVEVMVFDTRVHVRCREALSEGGVAITYLAYPTSDAGAAERVTNVLIAAQVAMRPLTVLYTPVEESDLAADIGCDWSDCRLIMAVGFGE